MTEQSALGSRALFCCFVDMEQNRNSKMRFSNIFSLSLLILCAVFLNFNGCEKSPVTPETHLIKVPPPERFPQEKDSIMVIDDVKLTISPYFWQDFMPAVPPQGPPFFVSFEIEVKNCTGEPLIGFAALVTTLYYSDTQRAFRSFRLTPVADTKTEQTILPGQEKRLAYTNDRTQIFSPEIEQGTKLYARIMARWDAEIHLLTSPPAGVGRTY